MLIEEALLHSHEDTQLHFVFDTQDEYEGGVRQIFRQWRESKRPGWQRLGGPSFEDKRDFEGLQLADLWAYTVNTSFANRPAEDTDRARALSALAKIRPVIPLADTNRFGAIIRRAEVDVITRLGKKIAEDRL